MQFASILLLPVGRHNSSDGRTANSSQVSAALGLVEQASNSVLHGLQVLPVTQAPCFQTHSPEPAPSYTCCTAVEGTLRRLHTDFYIFCYLSKSCCQSLWQRGLQHDMYSTSVTTRPSSGTLASSRRCSQQLGGVQRYVVRGRPARAPSASFNGVPLTTTATAPPASISEQLQQQLPSISVPSDMNVDLDTAKEVRWIQGL